MNSQSSISGEGVRMIGDGRGNILEKKNDNLQVGVEAVSGESLSPNFLFNREDTGNFFGFRA
jgi:hypothetical protein